VHCPPLCTWIRRLSRHRRNGCSQPRWPATAMRRARKDFARRRAVMTKFITFPLRRLNIVWPLPFRPQTRIKLEASPNVASPPRSPIARFSGLDASCAGEAADPSSQGCPFTGDLGIAVKTPKQGNSRSTSILPCFLTRRHDGGRKTDEACRHNSWGDSPSRTKTWKILYPLRPSIATTTTATHPQRPAS
jgi:hypothetical protein